MKIKNKILILFFLLFSYIKSDTEKYDIDEFKQTIWFWKSKSEGTYEINTGLEKNHKVIGYLNNYDDKYTNLIVYDKKDNNYNFYLAEYKKSDNFVIKENLFSKKIDGYNIHNVIGNVFSNDNKVSYLVTLYKPNENENDNYFNYENYFYCKKSGDKYEEIDLNITSNTFVADIDGDKNLEIIYYNQTENLRKVMKLNSNCEIIFVEDFNSFTIQNKNSPSINSDKFSIYGTNAFIDVNNDCKNELLLTVDSINENDNTITKKLLIYVPTLDNNNQIKYGLNDDNTIILENDFGPFALGDFDNDGNVDLIFPSIDGNTVTILLNQGKVKNKWTEEFCPNNKDKELNNLFSPSKKYTFNLTENKTDKIYYDPSITHTSIRIGDFISSGRHGILTILANKNENNEILSQSVVLYKINKNKDNLELELELNLTEKFPDLNNKLQYASFFDFGEDGTLDVIVVTDDEAKYCTRGFYRNVDNSNYFVTAQLSATDDDKDCNLIEVGAGYHYVVTNNNGDRRIDYSWQLAQTGDLNLNLNYAYMGLGRTNNYLENLEIVSVSRKNNNNNEKNDKEEIEYKQYTPIIPKSQLVVKKVGTDWHIDLIVQPADKIILMMVIIFFILMIILGIIIYLHLKEVKEDKNQAKQFTAWY
jgi:integrin alpha FG-GAP repeat containing protein 1